MLFDGLAIGVVISLAMPFAISGVILLPTICRAFFSKRCERFAHFFALLNPIDIIEIEGFGDNGHAFS